MNQLYKLFTSKKSSVYYWKIFTFDILISPNTFIVHYRLINISNYEKIKSLALVILLISCTNSNYSESLYNTDEILFVVEMDSNEGKTVNDITEFSEFYTDAIDKNEPNSLGWGFYESGDKIILIERYLNGDAMMQHGKNISEGGVLETQFIKFMEHFTINKIDVYGNASDELKEFVKPFGLPFYFHKPYAKFSRG